MCPICWTTAIALFGSLLAASATMVVGRDRVAQGIIVYLLGLAALNRAGYFDSQWWLFGIGIVALLIRIVWLMHRLKHEILIARIWQQCVASAARRCPSKQSVVDENLV